MVQATDVALIEHGELRIDHILESQISFDIEGQQVAKGMEVL